MIVRFALVAVLCLVPGVGHAAAGPPEEPRYQNRRLGTWLLAMPDFLECHPTNCRPFVAMGSNAVPYLAWVVGRTNIGAGDVLSLLRTMQARRTFEPTEEMLRSVQAKAAYVLEQLGSAARPATPALLVALRQGAGNQRLAAGLALGAIAPRHPRAHALLEALLAGGDRTLPLADPADPDSETVVALARLAIVPRAGSWERAVAAVGLCMSSQDRSLSAQAIARHWTGLDRGVRLNLLPLLSSRLRGDALPVLRAARTDPDPGVRQNATLQLGTLGDEFPAEVTDALIRGGDDESPKIRLIALQLLWRLRPGSDAAVDAALRGLEDQDASVRAASVSRLSRYSGPRVDEVPRGIRSQTKPRDATR